MNAGVKFIYLLQMTLLLLSSGNKLSKFETPSVRPSEFGFSIRIITIQTVSISP